MKKARKYLSFNWTKNGEWYDNENDNVVQKLNELFNGIPF